VDKAKVAFIGFGEVNSPQELLARKCRAARAALESEGLELLSTDHVTDDPRGAGVARALDVLGRGGFDCIVACVAGWIPSAAVIAVLAPFRHVPVILWGLAGHSAGGRLVTTADQAGTSALRSVLAELGFTFRYVYDTPEGKSRAPRVAAMARAASAAARLRTARIGMMGYRDMNLYGTMFDGVGLKRALGVEIETFEMLEIAQIIEKLPPAEVEAVMAAARARWTFQKPAADATLRKGASWYLALRRKIEERGYQAVSLIDVNGMKKLVGFPPAMVFMLLADELGLPTIPENDSLGAVTQLLVKGLTGQIAAYMEFYEFMEDRVLVGVPDYVPSEVVDGPVTVLPASFGGFSEGILNVSRVRTGRVTLCRLFARGGAYALHAVTGEAVAPRPWEEAGWSAPAPQLPSLEIVLDSPMEEFAQNVMSQHYIVAYGDIREALHDACAVTGLQMAR
jgi:L-fucose isomerase-like protein